MDALDRFARYAIAFEQALVTDDWASVAEHFTDDAVYETFGHGILAGCAEGRRGVTERLRRSVDTLDRRFDERLPEILEGPSEREGGVWMRFALRLTRVGLPDLRITGDHTAYFHGGRICRIEEYVPTPVGKAVDAYLAAHDAALKPRAVETSTAPLVRLAV
jgi:hypothetical protein